MRALVTGASRGIGHATALRLAKDGFEVGVHYHAHREPAEELVRRIRSAGGTAFLLSGNLARASEVEAVAAAVAEQWDALEALVLNAGAYPRGSFRELTPARFEECFRTNVFGAAELVRRLLPLLEAADPGRVVFLSSILAFDGSRHGAHYAAAKAAVLGLARSLARELAPKVLVNVVAPGAIDTAILAGDTAEQRQLRERRIPLGRIGRPEEVAEAIAFLASSRASYMTGATIHVNGGVRAD
jgi:3-oxoacyl-[acyl-carrier protein] reductase